MKNTRQFFLLMYFLMIATAGAGAQEQSLQNALNPDGTLRAGADGSYNAQGYEMRLGPNGEPMFMPQTQNTVSGFWDTQIGQPGLNGNVFAIAVSGNNVFVGGFFTQAGGVSANFVARYDLTTNTWSSLGTGAQNGVNGQVNALAIDGLGRVYVGGFFTEAGGVSANRVARFDPATNTWSTLSTGAQNGSRVNALAIDGSGKVYVGGDFTQAGGGSANYVARFDPATNAWSTLGTVAQNGVNNRVNALAIDGSGKVYVGGNFTQAGGVSANQVARFDPATNTWSTLGTGSNNGVSFVNPNPSVLAFAIYGNDVIVGGQFTSAGGVSANRVARYSPVTNTWSALGVSGSGVNSFVNALVVSGDILFVGGQFPLLTPSNQTANRLAIYNFATDTWSVFGSSPNIGMDGAVFALAMAGGDLLAGGAFTQAGGITSNRIGHFRLRPTNFPTGLPMDSLQLWLRGDFVDTASGRVATWIDLSGRIQNAVQNDAAIRPTFVPNAVNGQPAIGFAGGSPPTLRQHFTINGNFRDFTAGMTAFVVVNPTATANSARFFELISSPDNSVIFIRNGSQSKALFGSIVNSSISALSSSGDMVNNSYQILTGRRASGSVQQFVATQLFQNAQNFGSGTTQIPVVANRTTNYIGRGQYSDNVYFQGQIAEMIIYNRALSDVEMTQVHSYLAQRYGIVQSTSANPNIAANQGGTFVLGNTGVTVTFITPSSTAGSLSGSVTNSRPNVVGSLPTGITNLAERFWTINQTNLTGYTCALTFDLSTLGGVQNFNNLKVLRRNNASSPWLNVETLPGVTITRNAPFITVAGLTSFSDFTIGSDASNQLPVELTEFGFRKVDFGIELHWRTATELNNSGFEVQRRSENRGASTEWHALGFVRGNGTTTEAQSYSFLDRTAVGKVQYRLKQIDFDGQFEYSNIIEVDAGLPKVFALEQNYPNPFNPTTVISYQLPVASEVSLKVYDVLGREVMTLVNGRQEAGAYNFTLNAASLSSGVYFYRLQSGNFVSTKKMMLVK